MWIICYFFYFQARDGIREGHVTGVRTCALPISVADWRPPADRSAAVPDGPLRLVATQRLAPRKRVSPLVDIVAAAHRRLGTDASGAPRLHLTEIGRAAWRDREEVAVLSDTRSTR